MIHYPYLIVGGGMTADAAIQGIREVDTLGPVAFFSEEKYPPYKRPPLSKDLWKGSPMEKIWLKGAGEGIEQHLGRRITAINASSKTAVDDLGEIYSFGQALLATGVHARRLPFGGDRIIYYRDLEDYERLRGLTGQGKSFVVIGGGFIGSEIAAALAMNGEKVTLAFPNEGIGARLFPHDLSCFLNDYYRLNGVEVLPGVSVAGVEEHGDRLVLKTNQGAAIHADHIIAGIGAIPNVELADSAGIRLESGIWVDQYLRTSQPDIYAAGDVASFYNPALETRMRVEHKDNAQTMGKLAGMNMAWQAEGGLPLSYTHLPFFYSDLFELGYEAVGELNPRLEIISDWQEPFRKGVVYYLKDKRVRGVLLWNVWDQVSNARRMITERQILDKNDLPSLA